MRRTGINHCNCSGVMSVCVVGTNVALQTLCDFSSGNNGCINFRKDLNNHCDNPAAQHEARHGKPIEPLTEKTVFDIRDLDGTKPTY